MYYIIDCDIIKLESGSTALTINNDFELAEFFLENRITV